MSRCETVAGVVPTREQSAIIDAARAGVNPLVIEAGAGTGKTTTLRMLEEVLPGSGQYTAFNAKLVEESKDRFNLARCNTTHSLAFRPVGYRYKRRLNGPRVRGDDVAKMLKLDNMILRVERLGETVRKTFHRGTLATWVLAAVRRFCQSDDKAIDAKHFPYIDGIDAAKDFKRGWDNNNAVRKHLLPFAEKAWNDLRDENGCLPFFHDCYLKVWELSQPRINADYIMLDEDQDTSPVVVSILRQQKNAHLILVGDENQAIYEWRGAINARRAFPVAEPLMLTESFRFGQSVADVANSILRRLERPTALRMTGRADRGTRVLLGPRVGENRSGEMDLSGDFDCLLCRTNAGAVGAMLRFVEQGKRPHLAGGNSDVVSFVMAAERLQQGLTTDHPDLHCFDSWVGVEDYAKSDEGEDMRLMVNLINKFRCRPIISALDNMPPENRADVVLSTSHKAKGREWDRVKLANDFRPIERMDDAELRVLYVAATRAKWLLDLRSCPPFCGPESIQVMFT